MKIGMCFFLPVKPFTSTDAVFQNAKIVLLAAAENCVTVNFVHVDAHFQFVLSPMGQLFNLLFGWVFEEEAVCVAVKNLNAQCFCVS